MSDVLRYDLVVILRDLAFDEDERKVVSSRLNEAADRIEELEAACERLGPWMSAAMEDPNVCAEMKTDITAWFIVLDGKL